MPRGLLLAGLLSGSVPAAGAPVIFSVTADVPYNAGELPTLEQDVLDHNLYSPSSFLVHLGDINQASEGCHEDRYRSIAEILRRSEVATFIVPGDNEWIDCADPDQGWAWWEEHLGRIHDGFCFSTPIETQSARPENFAFVRDGVLFVGLNRPTGLPADLTVDDAAWVDAQFAAHGAAVRAVVLMSHSLPDGALATAVRNNVGAWGGPVLYLQGNGHTWDHEVGWLGYPNLERVQVDMGGAAPPVQVTVTDSGAFVFDRDPWPAGTPLVARDACAARPIDHAVDVRVGADADDAEQDLVSGVVTLTSSDLELARDGSRAQVVGLRFTNLAVPRGATIVSATVQFTVDEVSTGAASLEIRGLDTDDVAPFSSAGFDLGTRATTQASASWSAPDWRIVGAAGADQETPDLAAVVQEIVARPGWAPGNDLGLVFTGTGRRTAESYGGNTSAAPRLELRYVGAAPVSVSVGVGGNLDDAEQDVTTGEVDLTSSDLELTTDGSHTQLVGLRFTDLGIPHGATILAASLQFTADQVNTGATVLSIRGQAADDAPPFTDQTSDLGARPTTGASASWSPAAWNTVGESGPAQRTTDLAAVVQEIVDRPGWAEGNAAVLLVSGTGGRVAEARDGSLSHAPELVVDYLP